LYLAEYLLNQFTALTRLADRLGPVTNFESWIVSSMALSGMHTRR